MGFLIYLIIMSVLMFGQFYLGKCGFTTKIGYVIPMTYFIFSLLLGWTVGSDLRFSLIGGSLFGYFYFYIFTLGKEKTNQLHD